MIKHGLQIFACNASRELACDISNRLGLRPGRIDIARFSNDNLRVQIQENVRERDVFVVQSFTEPVSEHIMELMITLDALRSASAQRITAVIPYYSYARSDKKDAPRISITGRLIADLLQTAGANRVLTMDLHADQVHGFFSVPVDHLTAVSLIAEHFRNRHDLSNMVAVATDAGGAKRTGRFSEKLGIPMAIIDKRRVSDTAVKQGAVVGEVAGRDVVIFEDEIATAGTLVSSVDTLEGRRRAQHPRRRHPRRAVRPGDRAPARGGDRLGGGHQHRRPARPRSASTSSPCSMSPHCSPRRSSASTVARAWARCSSERAALS